MSSLEIALLAFACLFGGALLGMWLRRALPGHHMSDESTKLLQLGLGIIGTMAGLVLGLLVGSATANYNAQRGELLDITSKIVLLDRMLAHYGPEAKAPRDALLVAVQQTLNKMWPQAGASGPQLDPAAVRGEIVLDDLEDLSATNDRQKILKPQAIGLALNIAQTRWLMFEQTGSSISTPLLVLLIFWFTITFVGFGIFSPPNATVTVALGLAALAVSGAIFVTLEMYTPFQGLVQIPSTPLRQALAHLGR
ncbi:MAG TPA: hypothetical protein VFE35_09955 [Candidatus Cybelea sp.]|nr:hypothetical protein [Candidatus Cybelea sp.]